MKAVSIFAILSILALTTCNKHFEFTYHSEGINEYTVYVKEGTIFSVDYNFGSCPEGFEGRLRVIVDSKSKAIKPITEKSFQTTIVVNESDMLPQIIYARDTCSNFNSGNHHRHPVEYIHRDIKVHVIIIQEDEHESLNFIN